MNRRTFLRALPALGAGLAALASHATGYVWGARQRFVPYAEDDEGQPLETVSVEFIDVQLARHGHVRGRMWVTVEDRWGRPVCADGVPCVSDKIDVEFLPSSPTYVRCIFRQAPTLRCGQTYYVTMRGDVTLGDAGPRVYARRSVNLKTASWFWVIDKHTGERLASIHSETSTLIRDYRAAERGWHEITVARRADGTPQLKLHDVRHYRLEPISPEYVRVDEGARA